MLRRWWWIILSPLALGGALYLLLPSPVRCVIQGRLTELGLSPDGLRFHTFNYRGLERKGPIQALDTHTGECVQSVLPGMGVIHGWAFSKDRRHLAVIGDAMSLRIVDWSTGRDWAVDPLPVAAVIAKKAHPPHYLLCHVNFTPTGKYLLLQSLHNEALWVVETKTGRLVDAFPSDKDAVDDRLYSRALLQDERRILLFWTNEKTKQFRTTLWDLETQRTIEVWEQPWHPRLACNGEALILTQFDTKPGKKRVMQPTVEMLDFPSLTPRGSIQLDRDKLDADLKVQLLPNRETWSVRYKSGTVEFWELRTLKRVSVVELGEDFQELHFSRDSRRVFSTNQKTRDIVAWDVATSKELWRESFSDPLADHANLSVSEDHLQVSWYHREPNGKDLYSLEVRDLDSGAVQIAWRDRAAGLWPVAKDRVLSVRHDNPADAANALWWRKHARTWLPGAFWKNQLLDMKTGQVLASAGNLQPFGAPIVSDDGSTWVGVARKTDLTSEVHEYIVWDVPQRTAWRGVLVPPLALFTLLVSWRCWRSRRLSRAAQAAQLTP